MFEYILKNSDYIFATGSRIVKNLYQVKYRVYVKILFAYYQSHQLNG